MVPPHQEFRARNRHWNVARDRSSSGKVTPSVRFVCQIVNSNKHAPQRMMLLRLWLPHRESFRAQLVDRASRTDGFELPVNALFAIDCQCILEEIHQVKLLQGRFEHRVARVWGRLAARPSRVKLQASSFKTDQIRCASIQTFRARSLRI